jgi:hypothetical protein
VALAPQRIRVNAVLPGSIFFDGGVWDVTKAQKSTVLRRHPGGNPVGADGYSRRSGECGGFSRLGKGELDYRRGAGR